MSADEADGDRAIIPLPRPPGPLLEYGKMFLLDGRCVQAIGQRWAAEDAAYAPVPGEPDPLKPEHVLVLYLKDVVSGQIIPPVSAEEFSAALDRAARGPAGRPATPPGG